ncbi:MAG: DNA polymerase III subunit alpha [Pseudomonadota bacterium]
MSSKSLPFIHLKVHSSYSLAEGAIKIPALIERCSTQDVPAVALTDTNNLFGAMEFSLAAVKAGVQPILGAQLSLGLARDDPRFQRHSTALQDTFDEMTLLVQSEAGYKNLSALLTLMWDKVKNGQSPHLFLTDIVDRAEGLIALTGGTKGVIGQLLLQNNVSAAQLHLEKLKSIFADRLYIEITRHGLAEEAQIEQSLLDLADTKSVALVATNEAFFLDEDMHEAHDALLCISAGTYVSEDNRRRVTREHRLKSSQEMETLFQDLPEAIENTALIAQRCGYMQQVVDPELPPYPTEKGESAELREQAKKGLEKRLATQEMIQEMTQEIPSQYFERLEHELSVIEKMGYAGYFLIVADFIQWAKRQEIPVGPGRGSGAGSIASWALTITDIDPIKFNLLFERFLNPERVSMPDFDIDFCQDRRDEVIEYVAQKYGQDRVAQIITFGKLQARAVIRDVGRVLQMPYGQVDRICKLIPNNPASPTTLAEAIESEPELKQMVEQEAEVKRLVEMGKQLEGLYRHASTHAAGVVIGGQPLQELVPLYYDSRSPMAATQFNMKDVEKAGLVKFDFLGLRTLTAMMRTIALVKRAGGTLELDKIPLDDGKTFELLNRCETVGVFQLESGGMIDVLRQLKPTRFEELIALVALYRPGPMDDIPRYLACKHGKEAVTYMHPKIQFLLEETFGVMVYQEQVMQIAQVLAGYTLGGADLLRRAMGKKIKSEMDAQRERFVDGAQKNGVERALASQIFDSIAKFAGYGFNKSHSAPYALIAYQTAYLKANYPIEYMAALMSLELSNIDKLVVLRQEVERMGIPLLPPDINASHANFMVEPVSEGRAGIRYALAAIKNVGEAAIAGIVAEREAGGPFKDIWDFCGRVDSSFLNRRHLEHLIYAGAFDSIHANRKQLFESIDLMICQAQTATQERNSSQATLFEMLSDKDMPQVKLAAVSEWGPLEKLQKEFDVIGFYLSAHPIETYPGLEEFKITKAKNVDGLGGQSIGQGKARDKSKDKDNPAFNLAGIVVSKRERTSNSGQRYAFVSLSDDTGHVEIVFFSDQLSQYRDVLQPGQAVYIQASARRDEDRLRLSGISAQNLDEKLASQSGSLQLQVETPDVIELVSTTLKDVAKGPCEISLHVACGDRKAVVKLKDRYRLSPQVLMRLNQWKRKEAA